MPVAPPAAVQGKHYTVVSGDTLNGIASRLQGPGNKVSASQLAEGIRLLNPQAFAGGASSGLKVGQDLLLPDSAVMPTASNAVAPAAAAPTPPAELQRTADQLSTAAIENQQLTQSLEALKAQTQDLQEQMSGKDKQIIALRSDLALAQSAARPAATPVNPPAAPVAPVQTPVATASSEPFISGAAAGAGLFEASSAQTGCDLGGDAGRAVDQTCAARSDKNRDAATCGRCGSGCAGRRQHLHRLRAFQRGDGHFAQRAREAAGAGRHSELLAEQGDGVGFVREERSALEHGVDPQTIQDIRDRFPQLKAADIAPSAAPAASIPLAAVAAASTLSIDKADDVLQADLQPEPVAQLDETTAAALNPQHADEFQLNLDDLSMDADWDLVDPFDSPPPRSKPAVETPPVEVDPGFSSDLTRLPEVFELSDEQFLSDFAEPDAVEPIEVVAPSAVDDLSDEFLDSFMNDDSDFDLLDLEEPPLSQINQAQVLIEDGQVESARELLQQVIDESDEEHRRMARELLARIS